MATEAGADIVFYVSEIKQEPVDVETDCKETQQIACDAEVKEEAVEAYAGCGVTQAAEQLYADHLIKQEMAIGPVVLQRCLLSSDADASKECLNTSYENKACKSSTSPVMNQNEDNPLHVRVCEHNHAGGNSPQYEGLEGDFNTNSDLTQHKQITRERPFCCKICQKKFIGNSFLSRHERTHTGEKSFTCKICQNQFASKSNLTQHQRIHTGEKPYCCKICKTQFTWKHSLIRHEHYHTGEKPFRCKTCEKSFICKGDLSRHEKPFCRKSNLNNHEPIHTRKKLFCCEACKKKFTLKLDLFRHRIVCDIAKMPGSLFNRFY